MAARFPSSVPTPPTEGAPTPVRRIYTRQYTQKTAPKRLDAAYQWEHIPGIPTSPSDASSIYIDDTIQSTSQDSLFLETQTSPASPSLLPCRMAEHSITSPSLFSQSQMSYQDQSEDSIQTLVTDSMMPPPETESDLHAITTRKLFLANQMIAELQDKVKLLKQPQIVPASKPVGLTNPMCKPSELP